MKFLKQSYSIILMALLIGLFLGHTLINSGSTSIILIFFCITALIIATHKQSVKYISYKEKIKLTDTSSKLEKIINKIPSIGGVLIYAELVIGISLFITPDTNSLTYLVCSSLIVALGIADDAKNLSPKFRLLVQSVVAILMCSGSGMHIQNLGNLLGVGVIDLGVMGYVVTVVAVIGTINAFNMIDGIDGLLGISSLIAFAGMGILFSLNNDSSNMHFSLLISVVLIPYLVANFDLSTTVFKKIFRGDIGAMLMGFTVIWLLIQGTQVRIPQPDGTEKIAFSASTALWLIAFPLMDMVRVIGGRVLRGRSPLEADRSHLHHILQDSYGDSKRIALLRISTLSVFCGTVGISYHIMGVREVISFLTFLMGFLLFVTKSKRLKSKYTC